MMLFMCFNVLLGLMAVTNLLGLALGKSPSIRQIVGQLQGADDGRGQLAIALTLAGAVQLYMIALIFPLKAFNHHLGLAWSLLMLLSVLETIYTTRKMKAVVSGDDTTGRFALHDSAWYTAYQIGYNLAIVGACVVLVAAPLISR